MIVLYCRIQAFEGALLFRKYSIEIIVRVMFGLENVVNTVNQKFKFFWAVSAAICSVLEMYRFCVFSKISTKTTFDESYMFSVDLFCLYSSVVCIVRREICVLAILVSHVESRTGAQDLT